MSFYFLGTTFLWGFSPETYGRDPEATLRSGYPSLAQVKVTGTSGDLTKSLGEHFPTLVRAPPDTPPPGPNAVGDLLAFILSGPAASWPSTCARVL